MLQLHIYTTFQMFVYVHFHACRRLKYTYTQAFTETQIAPPLPSQTHNINTITDHIKILDRVKRSLTIALESKPDSISC